MTDAFDTGRRRFVRRTLAAGAAVGLLSPADLLGADESASAPAAAGSAERPRNIVWVVSDGMSAAVPGLAEAFSQQVRGCGTAWRRLALDRSTVQGGFETAAFDSPVPDSAAAASAWGSGSLVANGSLNYLPDGSDAVPIALPLGAAGRRIGLVTTTRVTDATPAGFAAAVPSRSQEDRIAEQYLGRVDLLLGGGRRHFGPQERDGVLLARYRDEGYATIRHRDELASVREGRVLGLFATADLPMTIDRRGDPAVAARVPTLAEMSTAALRVLSASERPFLLQIEGARVDHAAHLNDPAGLLWDQLDLDDALAVALRFAAERGDTLVVATSDHGNANPGLNGTGRGYRSSGEVFARVAEARRSVEWLLPRLARDAAGRRPEALDALVHEALGIRMTQREREALQQAGRGETDHELNPQFRNVEGQLGRILSAHLGIGWCGTSHTADWMQLFATGPGADRFAGLMHHREAFTRISEAMGVV